MKTSLQYIDSRLAFHLQALNYAIKTQLLQKHNTLMTIKLNLLPIKQPIKVYSNTSQIVYKFLEYNSRKPLSRISITWNLTGT